MKHFGNFVALLIVAVNALFTGLLLLVAYSPYIQPATHPVQSGLCTYQRRLSDFLAGYTTIQDSFATFNRPSVMLLAATDLSAP